MLAVMVDANTTEGRMVDVVLATVMLNALVSNDSHVDAVGVGLDDGCPIAAPVGGQTGVAHCISPAAVSRGGGGELRRRHALQLPGLVATEERKLQTRGWNHLKNKKNKRNIETGEKIVQSKRKNKVKTKRTQYTSNRNARMVKTK
jgi:hypothetical protein